MVVVSGEVFRGLRVRARMVEVTVDLAQVGLQVLLLEVAAEVAVADH